MVLLALCISDGQLLYDVSSLAELRSRAAVHFLMKPSQQLKLSYREPEVSSGGSVVGFNDVEVKNETDFSAAIRVWDVRIRPVQLQRREALLPTFFATVVDVFNPPTISAATAIKKQRAPAMNKALNPNESVQEDQSTATVLLSPVRPLAGDDTSMVGNVVYASKVAPPVVDTDWYKSHQFALQLLGSFQQSDPEDPPSIRVTLRGGQCSCRVPFNAYNRPDSDVLKNSVQAALLQRLSPADQKRITSGMADGTLQFLMYATTPSSDVDIDVDDNADVALLCEEIKALNRDRDVPDDFSVQLVAEWVELADVPQVRTEPRFVSTDLVDEVVLPPRSALSVNLAHTPKRERHEIKSFAPDDENGGDGNAPADNGGDGNATAVE